MSELQNELEFVRDLFHGIIERGHWFLSSVENLLDGLHNFQQCFIKKYLVRNFNNIEKFTR